MASNSGFSHYYLLGNNADSQLDFGTQNARGGRKWSSSKGSTLLAVLSIILNVVLVTLLLARTRELQPSLEFHQLLYTPAQDIVRYKAIKWDPAHGQHSSIYDQEPSEDVDTAWDNLYKHSISKIPQAQAELLPNHTSPIEGEEGYYMMALDVFHQLHCLNTIRKALNPEYYPLINEPTEAAQQHGSHLPHCLAIIRQSLMCFADVTPVVWQWSEEARKITNRMDVVHSCRDFDAIQQWAEQNRLRHKVDLHNYIEDDH